MSYNEPDTSKHIITCDLPIKEVILENRSVYGTETYYPLSDCDVGNMITDLMGTKTVTIGAIRTMNKYGYRFYYITARGEKEEI